MFWQITINFVSFEFEASNFIEIRDKVVKGYWDMVLLLRISVRSQPVTKLSRFIKVVSAYSALKK